MCVNNRRGRVERGVVRAEEVNKHGMLVGEWAPITRSVYEWDCANFLALWTQLTAVVLSVCTLFIRMFTYINLVAPRKISITY